VTLRELRWAALILAGGAGCRAPGGEGGAHGAGSAAAAPRPHDTSWEQSPGRPLVAGEPAPNFEGIAHTGMRVRLSSFTTEPVVVLFYPDDRDAASLSELRDFRDQWLSLTGKIGMVLGVSPDDRTVHKDVATGEHLPFLLLSDGGGKIARAFGVAAENGRTKRTTFVVGSDLRVLRVFENPSTQGPAQEVLSAPPERAPH
jgi:thioredoxin-dependent peroxiredoxin